MLRVIKSIKEEIFGDDRAFDSPPFADSDGVKRRFWLKHPAVQAGTLVFASDTVEGRCSNFGLHKTFSNIIRKIRTQPRLKCMILSALTEVRIFDFG